MTIEELREWTKEASETFPYVVFPEELVSALTDDLVKLLTEEFGSKTLMRLPKSEIEFFEWLRREDPDIWKDLWELDEDNGDPYVVSMKFLPVIMQKTRGFPICDLVNHDNYYFTDEHMVDKESKIMLESVQKRFLERKQISTAQLLMLEISLFPVDIWRFAYNHELTIAEAKDAARALVNDNTLVHLTESEHLVNFIKI